MPTKPNRAGEQQNYVPKGNGDASGEYGDNESGSNVHFKAFKKPEETATTTGISVKVAKTPKAAETTNTAGTPKVDDNMDASTLVKETIGKSQLNEKNKANFFDGFSKGTKEAQNDIGNLLKKLPLKYGLANRAVFSGGNTIKLEPKKANARTEDSFYHEHYHAIDYLYSQDNNDGLGKKYASRSVKLSSGKTLQETLQEEYQNADALKEIRDILDNYEGYRGAVDNYNKALKEYVVIKRADARFEEVWGNYRQALKTYNEFEGKRFEAYGNLADILCQATRGEAFEDYGGHKKSYWRNGRNTSEEFFAEAGQMLATGKDTEEAKIAERLFPKSFGAVKELLGLIRTGKVKRGAQN